VYKKTTKKISLPWLKNMFVSFLLQTCLVYSSRNNCKLTSGVKKNMVSSNSPFFCRAVTTRPIAASRAVTIPRTGGEHSVILCVCVHKLLKLILEKAVLRMHSLYGENSSLSYIEAVLSVVMKYAAQLFHLVHEQNSSF